MNCETTDELPDPQLAVDPLRELYDKVLRICRRRWRNSRCGISAEDIAQEAMLAAHVNAGGLTGVDLERYVSGIVAHKTNDAHRLAYSREQYEQPVDETPDMVSASTVAEHVLASMYRDDLFAALTGLHWRHRQVLALRYLLGFSLTETAELMSMSEAAVRVSAHRATAAARRILGGTKP